MEVIDEKFSTRKSIGASLQDQLTSKQVKLETVEGKLKITFVDKILFNSGSVQVNQEGQQTLMLQLCQSPVAMVAPGSILS